MHDSCLHNVLFTFVVFRLSKDENVFNEGFLICYDFIKASVFLKEEVSIC